MEENNSTKPKAPVFHNIEPGKDHVRIDDAAERFKSEKKLNGKDRISIAQNLGKMFDDVRRKDTAFNMHKPFKAAFTPADNAESQYKKRKDFIWLASENPDPKILRTTPQQYMGLYQALIERLLPERTKEARNRIGFSHLLEGTSFIRVGGYSEGLEHEQREEIQKQLDRVVQRVRDEVDLDWMAAFCSSYKPWVKGEAGTLYEVWPQPVYGHLEYDGLSTATMALYDSIENAIAPCINLATVLTPLESANYVIGSSISVDSCIENDDEDSQKKEKVAASLLANLGYSKSEIEKLVDDFPENLYEEEIDLGDQAPTLEFSGYLSTRLDLELRFDTESEQWRSVLLWRLNDRYGKEDPFLRPGNHLADKRGRNLVELFQSNLSDTTVIWYAPESGYEVTFVYMFESADAPSLDTLAEMPLLGMQHKLSFHSGEEDFCKLLLTPIPGLEDEDYPCNPYSDDPWTTDHRIKLTYQDYGAKTRFVKAPRNSISEFILQNLAYAEPEKRIDELLLIDAKEKFRQLKEFADKSSEEYREAIDKNLSGGSE